jgi:hypothetical protein
MPTGGSVASAPAEAAPHIAALNSSPAARRVSVDWSIRCISPLPFSVARPEVSKDRTADDGEVAVVSQGRTPWLLNMDNPCRVAACKVSLGGADDNGSGSLIPEVFDKLYWQKFLPRTGLNPMMVISLGSTLIRPASRIVGVNPGLVRFTAKEPVSLSLMPLGPLISRRTHRRPCGRRCSFCEGEPRWCVNTTDIALVAGNLGSCL